MKETDRQTEVSNREKGLGWRREGERDRDRDSVQQLESINSAFMWLFLMWLESMLMHTSRESGKKEKEKKEKARDCVAD